ncbi:fractalkine [Sorex fumeus]|uniref:fractalkine n=1 Tax=Sorex fumeus TaxID=62283 RepID=UPI0024ACCEE5|nr:fractalkine [Sorex fumeus]
MAPSPLPWLLRLAALCHLTVLLDGQHLGVKKCSIICNRMTSEIPSELLINYRRSQESCGKRAIILETKKHKLLCADPTERWVQRAMERLDRQAAARTPNGGTFEKQIGIGQPGTTLAARATHGSAAAEPKGPGDDRGQEGHVGTSPPLPTRAAAPWETRPPSAAQGPDGGAVTGPARTQLPGAAALTTTAAAWHSSAASQPGPEVWAEGKTPAPQATPTQSPPPQLPTTAHTAPEDILGPTGQTAGAQDPLPEGSLGPPEAGPVSAHPDAFLGPGGIPHVSAVPISSEWDPSREPVASGSWAPKVEEPVHATVDPQRLGVLMTPVPDSQVATRRQAVGLLAFLGLLFCVGVAMFAYQSLQGCPRKVAGDVVEGLRYVPRSCGSNSYVLVPV